MAALRVLWLGKSRIGAEFAAERRAGAGVLCIHAVAHISRRTRRDIVCRSSHSGEVVVDRSPHRSLCACRTFGRFQAVQYRQILASVKPFRAVDPHVHS